MKKRTLAGLTLMAVCAALSACSAAPHPTLTTDINYTSGKEERSHLLDVAVPYGNGSFPLVIWIHGGAWLAGDKTDCPAGPLLKNGFAVASINYRLSQEAKFPAQINDCKAGAIRYLRAHAAQYNIDPKRIGVWGVRPGGHLVALLGTSGGVKSLEGALGNQDQSSTVQAVCDWYGPGDLNGIAQQAGPDWQMDLKSKDAPQYKLVGGRDAQLLKEASPNTYIDKSDPPILIMHGDSDKIVPLAQSEELYKQLKAAGVDAKLMVIKGAGHGFSMQQVGPVIDFFKDKLR